MRKFLYAFISLLVILLGLLIILPGLVPSSVYKEKIEAQLSKELGRNLSIDGDIKVASFPSIRAKTNDVTIENYPGFKSDEFIKIRELGAKIRLLPLLSKRVDIQGFNLTGAEIYLERKSNGDVNWVDPSAPIDETTPSEKENESFKRDGRFTSFDPQISAFNISEGRLIFLDDLNNQTYEADEIKGRLSLAGLNSPLITNMSLTYQGEPLEINLELETPERFLRGEESPFDLALNTDFVSFDVKGKFTNSENINLIADVKSNISDVQKLIDFSPQDIPYANLLNSGRFDGNISFTDGVLDIKNSSTDLEGEHFKASYQGNILLDETPVLSGELVANVADPKALADSLSAYLEFPLPQAALLGQTSVTAKFSSDGKNTKADRLSLETKGDILSGRFDGEGQLSGDNLTVTGNFDASLEDIDSIIQALDDPTLEAYSSLLGSLKADGQIALADQSITITDLQTTASDGDINGSFTGDIEYEEKPKINGVFDVTIPDFLVIDQKLDLNSPYSASVKMIAANGNISTNNDIFSLTEFSANLSEGLINGEFGGKADYSLGKEDALSLSGTLESKITDVRQLAALNGTELPADTDLGAIFETASFSGKLQGTTQALSISDVKLAFDELQGTGNLNIAMQSTRPTIDATLGLDGLDLRPYMASYSAQNPTGEIQPWSETPFNVEAFGAIDGNISISTPNILTDRLSLGQSEIKANLKNGVLKADMPNLLLYGGGGRGALTFDTSKSVPELTFNMSLEGLNGEGFLGAVAGFTKVIGTAETELSVTASGASQASLMRSLNGQGDFGLTGGQIKGVDIVRFTTGLDEAFKSRSLPAGLGVSQTTSFEALKGLFSINKGIVSINEFDVSASGVSAKGLGEIDLGNQAIDFKLRPRLNTENAKGIAAFGIPLQFSGGFGDASAGLDSDFLSQIVQERAKAKLADTVRGQVKGPVGNILSGVIGGEQSSTQNNKTQTESISSEEAINSVIGGLFGGNAQQTTTNSSSENSQTQETENQKEPTEPEKKKEEKTDIEKALGSLFGD